MSTNEDRLRYQLARARKELEREVERRKQVLREVFNLRAENARLLAKVLKARTVTIEQEHPGTRRSLSA